MELIDVLRSNQSSYRNGLGTCDATLCVSYTPQSALESGLVARIVQIDFSAAIDRANYQRIFYKHCSLDIGASVFSILTQFLSNRSHMSQWTVLLSELSG